MSQEQAQDEAIEGRDYMLVCDRCWTDAPGGHLVCTCLDGDVSVYPCARCGFDRACGPDGEECHS